MFIINKKIRKNKKIEKEMEVIYGIGEGRSINICKKEGINKNVRVRDLEQYIGRDVSRRMVVEGGIQGELITNRRENIERKKEKGTYEGFRHIFGLPVRGQKTKNNSKKRKR